MKLKRNLLYKGLRYYNTLPDEVKNLTHKKFKIELKDWTIYDLPVDINVPPTKATKKTRLPT